MTLFGAVILFDVVATLGGGAFPTLGLGAATLGAGVPVFATLGLGAATLGAFVPAVRTVGPSSVCLPAKIAVTS